MAMMKTDTMKTRYWVLLIFVAMTLIVFARQHDDSLDIQNQLSSVIAKLDKINQDHPSPQTLQAEDLSTRALRALQDYR